MTETYQYMRRVLDPFRAALYDFEPATARDALHQVATPDALFRLAHPFGEMQGPDAFFDNAIAMLGAAMPDLERRDWIVMAGPDQLGNDWIGCGGTYTGTFVAPFLDIPPTGHIAHMRFHEFYRIVDGKVVEMQAIWDIPELMMQANAWPMAPSLGREMWVPSPATQDGLMHGPRAPQSSDQTCQHIIDMLQAMKRHPSQGGPEVMELERYWHPRFMWYGPAGIGAGRGVSGFRHWHQIPFLAAMPDRGQFPDEVQHYFFGDNAFAGVTGWPNMMQTITNDGWMGIAASGQKVSMRSLDFWRLENGRIRENWVLVDLLHLYAQCGVDVLARMRAFNKARPSGPIPIATEVQ